MLTSSYSNNEGNTKMKKVLLLVTIAILATPAFAGRGKVVATVNGANIYEDSVKLVSAEIPAESVEQLGGEATVRKTIIEQLAAAEALKQSALKSGVDKSKNFQKILKVEKERLIQEEYLRVQVEKRVSDKKIKETYDTAVEKFVPQMEYNIYNILSETEKDAKKIIKSLKKGADFQELAVEKSGASNVKDTKGNLGFIKQSDLIEDIGKEIAALEEGKFSAKPVKSPFGWNVFLLKEKRLEKAPSFEASKETIKQALYKQEMMNIIKELKDKAKIEYK